MLVTLLSDFGSDGPYPAQMKAVLAGLTDATVVDISHDVRRHDVRMGAYLLAAVAPHTPAGTVHLAVVDPGVGTARAPLMVAAGGQVFVGPDNGLLLPAARRVGRPRVFAITHRQLLDRPISPTFHGRDLFAVAAGWLAAGMPVSALGTPAGAYVDLDFGQGRAEGRGLIGEVIYIDPFGNLITNIPATLLVRPGVGVEVAGGRRAQGVIAATYGEAAPGQLVVVPGSDGLVEIAVREGDAAARLAASAGQPVRIAFLAADGRG